MSLPRSTNLLTGWIAIGLIAALALYFGISALLSPPAPVRKRYVAYFDHSGGIEVDDAVRIKGRRAGRVTDVQLVQHEGRLQARVEFEIAPGTSSEWLKTQEIPADSRIAISLPTLRGRPTLIVNIGESSTEFIAPGGEWKNAKGVAAKDMYSTLVENFEKVQQAVDEYGAFFRDEARVQALKDQAAEIRAALERVDRSMELDTDALAGISDALAELKQSLDQATESMRAQHIAGGGMLGRALAAITPGGPDFAGPTQRNLRQLNAGVSAADAGMDSAAKGFHGNPAEGAEPGGLLGSVLKLEKALDDGNKQLQSAGLGKLAKDLRKMSAELRASSELGAGDPSQFGGGLPWRKYRRYFNGDSPLPGGVDGSKTAADARKAPRGTEKERENKAVPTE